MEELNFWMKLKENKKPFFALAPMADVTDSAFRRIVTKYGKPDVLWTEFVSADGLDSEGAEALKKDLEYTKEERPIVAQLFSSKPEKMYKAVSLCIDLGFDGIDINMGCPDKAIERQGCGSAMIKNPENAVLIIHSAKKAIIDSGKKVPLSVKTRVGYNKPDIEGWIKLILEQNIDALTIHARTRKDLSKVPANWDYVKQVVDLKNKIAPKTIIIGNGDVLNTEHGKKLAKQTGCDGVMIGRAIFGNPWLFNVNIQTNRTRMGILKSFLFRVLGKKDRYWLRNKTNIDFKQKLKVLVEHSELFQKLLVDQPVGGKNFSVMKKHFKAYVNGFRGAKELRMELMENGNDPNEVKKIIDNFMNNNNF